MQELFNRKKTCAFTGHRNLPDDFNVKKLEEEIVKTVSLGYDTFLVGMAVGFDSLCFNILYSVRKIKDIKIVACIPCKNQSEKFSFKQKEAYEKMLDLADKRIVLSENYTPYCMMKRNMFMVDNCSRLICYLRENKGGTKNTVDYAKNKKDVTIIEL